MNMNPEHKDTAYKDVMSQKSLTFWNIISHRPVLYLCPN